MHEDERSFNVEAGREALAALFASIITTVKAAPPEKQGCLGEEIEHFADKHQGFWRHLNRRNPHMAMLFDMLADQIDFCYVSTDPDAEFTCRAAQMRWEWAQEEKFDAERRAKINAALNACHSG